MNNQLLKRLFLAAALIVLIGQGGLSLSNRAAPEDQPPAYAEKTIRLSDQRRTHILYGDRTGGGHLAGINAPCKSEFPKTWSEQKVVDEITTIAANDNLSWKQQQNGFHVADQMVEGVKVRVVLNARKDEIITAYPTNTTRNPCPSRQHPSNDNNP